MEVRTRPWAHQAFVLDRIITNKKSRSSHCSRTDHLGEGWLALLEADDEMDKVSLWPCNYNVLPCWCRWTVDAPTGPVRFHSQG